MIINSQNRREEPGLCGGSPQMSFRSACVVYDSSFGVGSDKLWGKNNYPKKRSIYKRKRNYNNIWGEIYLFEFCLS